SIQPCRHSFIVSMQVSSRRSSISSKGSIMTDAASACAHCHQAGENEELFRCDGCYSVFYCSAAHQTIDWEAGHSEECSILRHKHNYSSVEAQTLEGIDNCPHMVVEARRLYEEARSGNLNINEDTRMGMIESAHVLMLQSMELTGMPSEQEDFEIRKKRVLFVQVSSFHATLFVNRYLQSDPKKCRHLVEDIYRDQCRFMQITRTTTVMTRALVHSMERQHEKLLGDIDQFEGKIPSAIEHYAVALDIFTASSVSDAGRLHADGTSWFYKVMCKFIKCVIQGEQYENLAWVYDHVVKASPSSFGNDERRRRMLQCECFRIYTKLLQPLTPKILRRDPNLLTGRMQLLGFIVPEFQRFQKMCIIADDFALWTAATSFYSTILRRNGQGAAAFLEAMKIAKVHQCGQTASQCSFLTAAMELCTHKKQPVAKSDKCLVAPKVYIWGDWREECINGRIEPNDTGHNSEADSG
ncbi:hypothetical protein SARC_10566, partial [Sphaeroforma arctica JP610]